MSDERAKGEALVVMFETFQKKVSSGVMNVFLKGLQEFNAKEVKTAIFEAIKTSRFCPTVADIRDLLKPSIEDVEMMAITEAGRLERSVSSGSEEILKCGDPISKFLVESRFRLFKLSNMRPQDFVFELKRFEQAYVKCYNSGIAMGHIQEGKGLKPLVHNLAEKMKPKALKQQQ